MSSDSAEQKPKTYNLDALQAPNETADPSNVLGTAGLGAPSKIDTELGQVPWHTHGQDLKTLTSYRDSISSAAVTTMAGNWRKHGDSLTSIAGQFSNEVKSKIVSSWDSPGGGVASTAVQRYADQLVQIAAVVEAVA